MKNIILFGAIILLLFSACSQEEEDLANQKSAISFEVLLNDFVSQKGFVKQQASNLPECSDARPAFVEIILSRNGEPVRGTADSPLRLLLNDGNSNEEFLTQESTDLELEPGHYTLEYFKVFDEEENLIWAAPIDNGSSGFSNFIDNPLPLDIDLGPGVKKYVEVDVLCFEDRFVNQFGYIFFDLNANEIIPFCIFGNYCLENGRHAQAARFRVDVWKFSGNSEEPKGINLYSELENGIIVNDFNGYSEISADPLCILLPDTQGEDQYYFEITILNFDYETDEKVIRSGVITDADVKSLFVGGNEVEYYHFREGNCNLGDSPELFDVPHDNGIDPDLDTDRDGVADVDDNCPYQYNPSQTGTEYYGATCFQPCEIKTDSRVHKLIGLDGTDQLFEFTNPFGFYGSLKFFDKDQYVGTIEGKFDGSNKFIVNVFINAGRYLEDHVIEIRDDITSESFCKIIHPAQIIPGTDGRESYSQFEIQVPQELSPPYYVRFKGNLYVDF